MKPILYLDVEGTLLLLGAGRAFHRPHLAELFRFIAARRDRMDCFWLTSFPRSQVERLFPAPEFDIQGIGYQTWGDSKARALSSTAPVLWVDDRLTDRDREVLGSLAAIPQRVVFRPIRRWDGNPEDTELQLLQRELDLWLDVASGTLARHHCSRVA